MCRTKWRERGSGGLGAAGALAIEGLEEEKAAGVAAGAEEVKVVRAA